MSVDESSSIFCKDYPEELLVLRRKVRSGAVFTSFIMSPLAILVLYSQLWKFSLSCTTIFSAFLFCFIFVLLF
jgi:hypothetical protein